jgi:hypothetical protein
MQIRAPQHFIAPAFVGVLLAALTVDTGLRLIEHTPLWRVLPVIEPILGQPDRDFGYGATPNAKGISVRENRAPVQINSLGLRDVERQRAKPVGTFRVGLLGDSMVEATQVSQPATFGALAEAKLQTKGHAVELINLAIAGPTPIRQLLRLEHRGYDMNLDLVMANSSAGSFIAGLLRDDSENPAYVDTGDGNLRRGYAFRERFSHRYAEHPLGRLFVALYQNSPLFRMVYLRAKEPWRDIFGLTTAQAARASGSNQPIPDDVPVNCVTTSATLDSHLALWRDHRPERDWKPLMFFLDDFAQSTEAHRVRVLYAIRDLPLTPRDCTSGESRREELVSIISSEFSRRGMRFVDWSATVAKTWGKRNLDLLRGFGIRRGAGHLNHEGHRIWAATLLDVLKPELPTAAAN